MYCLRKEWWTKHRPNSTELIDKAKKEIIGMIQKIESVRFLAMIYSFTHTLFEKEKNQWGD